MAGQDVEHHDPLTFFRTELSPADVARYHQEWAIQKQRDHDAAVVGWSVIGLIGLLLAFAAVIHRRRITRAADAALIASLASGVRSDRYVATKRDRLINRVLAEADRKPSEQD